MFRQLWIEGKYFNDRERAREHHSQLFGQFCYGHENPLNEWDQTHSTAVESGSGLMHIHHLGPGLIPTLYCALFCWTSVYLVFGHPCTWLLGHLCTWLLDIQWPCTWFLGHPCTWLLGHPCTWLLDICAAGCWTSVLCTNLRTLTKILNQQICADKDRIKYLLSNIQ